MTEVRPSDRPWEDLAWQLWVEEPAHMRRLTDDLAEHGQLSPVCIGPTLGGYSTRKVTDSARMARLMGKTGDRRLSYRPLTERG